MSGEEDALGGLVEESGGGEADPLLEASKLVAAERLKVLGLLAPTGFFLGSVGFALDDLVLRAIGVVFLTGAGLLEGMLMPENV